MSLLLDALKKAADDKKKNLVTDESVDQSTITDESLELDLNLDSDAEEASTGDDFPDVNETTIPQANIDDTIENKPTKDTIAKNEYTSSDVIAAETSTSNISESIENNLETDSLEATDKETPDLSTKSEMETIADTNDTEDDKDINIDESVSNIKNPAANENRSFTKSIENEQALLALINKTNQHSKQAQLKQTITVAILVSLLLIGFGLFFYIKMDTASQEIFIANNNQAPVNRDFETQPNDTTPVSTEANKIAEVTIAPKKNITRKTVQKSKPIHIVQSEKQDPVSTLILEAYNHFHNENYEQANKLYNQVLLREPKNRDALLGLSAIAVKQQRYEFARQKYQYLIRLNPKDSIAIAGMSSIKNDIDPQLNESQLKFMLKEKPDSAHLYFALGTLYSSHNKWPEAQSAFFSAWSTDNKNADYAYNLAVSLDHLDKHDQALNFYNLSLKLKQASSGSFSTESVSQRIFTLKENNE